MSEIPAFPIISWKSPDGMYATEVQRGMTLRDYFAVHADQPGRAEIVTRAGFTYAALQVWKDEQTSFGTFEVWWRDLTNEERFRLSAEVRYAMADAMLKARAALPTPPINPPVPEGGK